MVNQRARSQPQTWVTYALIAANVAAFAYEFASGAQAGSPTPQQMIDLGGDFAPLTLDGQWWRVVTSMFLHYGIWHIAMNMICLYQGRIVEIVYGRAGFAALYLAAGLAGSIASLARASNVVSAGASGAVFGVFGAFGAYLLLRRDRLDPVAVKRTAGSLALFIGINMVIGITTPGIDMSAHIGGLIAGFVAGVALLAGARPDARSIVRAIAVAVVAVAATASALKVLPVPASVVRQHQLDNLNHIIDGDQQP
jgi:rhomboid protease GluP